MASREAAVVGNLVEEVVDYIHNPRERGARRGRPGTVKKRRQREG
jgi:hypothetical protein